MHQTLPIALFLTDEVRVPDPIAAVDALPMGVGVIVRDYGRADRAEVAAAIVEICRDSGRLVLIAGDAGLARALNADGVHWPAAMVASHAVRRHGFDVVTAAAHNRREVTAAVRARANAVLVSPVFPTASHPGHAALGVNAFARLALAAPVPVYAMGGVRVADGGRLAMAGAAGIAGIGLFL